MTAAPNAPLRRAIAPGAAASRPASTAASPLAAGTEVPLSAEEFERICTILFAQSAIVLKEGKEGLVRSRLAKHVRRLGLDSYTEYLAAVDADVTGRERLDMIDSLTTNKTSFYREGAHFEYLQDVVMPKLLGARDRIRIWSAGCSSGEEPYTLSMLLHELVRDPAQRDVRILATDLSSKVLGMARAATYPAAAIADLPWHSSDRYFTRVPGGQGMLHVRDDVRALVKFARLNLMEQWPMERGFQVIMCRNVMIYFDKQVQARLVDRFWELLAPGGHLFVGHSESLTSLKHRFTYVQPAVYVK
ncbi:MAG: CheR family methyltransferase [Gemmatimonadales bacterium]